MLRLVLLVGVSLLMANECFAQDSPGPDPMQCRMIKLAVAQYGYAAARQHAMETYGPEAVRIGDKCFAKEAGRSVGAHASREFGAERSAGMR